MALKVYNTRARAVEEFRTKEPGRVRMYVCGPSVYDRSHIGHARSYVFYDALKRYLLKLGYEVEHVQNFTDVEENIAKRSEEAGLKPLEYAERLIDAFFEDMDALHILRATHYPRVSENVEEMQRIIQELLDKDAAYLVECDERKVCDVYFDVTTVPDFGSMVGRSVEDISADEIRHKGERRHPLDFALWKSKDDWGVTWPSPWGDGRPGWHIECTAMALKHLGADFDLHGGGLDLVFPHHASEDAIGEAFTGEPYCQTYVHNGFITVDRAKMSKSKGNFVTVQDMLRRHDPEAIRLFLLGEHYRKPLNYAEDAVEQAAERLARWRAGVQHLETLADDAGPTQPPDAFVEFRARFFAALDEDLRFDEALPVVDEAAEAARGVTDAGEAAAALEFFEEVSEILGAPYELDGRWRAPS